MSKQVRTLLIAGVVIALVVGGVFLVWWTRGGSGDASQEIAAPTLDTTQIANADSNNAIVTEETSATEESASTEEANTSEAQGTVFEIVKEESQVNFNIQEDLMGSRITVVGTTNEIAGQIFVDFANPANSQLGTIRINMRTLKTDNEFRNRALRNDILQTSQSDFEFSDFVTTSIEGLPASVVVGEPITFKIIGTLTLRGVPQPITFDATVTPVTETQLTGTATATVKFAELGINIPQVPPSVANIGEDVVLNLTFVANAVTASS